MTVYDDAARRLQAVLDAPPSSRQRVDLNDVRTLLAEHFEHAQAEEVRCRTRHPDRSFRTEEPMSTSTDAILAYGYDLGENLPFIGVDDYQYPGWWDGEEDFESAAVRRLIEADPQAKYAGLPVGIETHCSDRSPMYALVIKATVTTASRGYPETITDLTMPEGAQEHMAWAVEVLGLDVGDVQPAWLLFSYWGS